MSQKHQEIVALAVGTPLPIYQSYFNYHKEEAFFFHGADVEFQRIRHYMMTNTDLKKVVKHMAHDTYFHFSKNKYTRTILNLRIRDYGNFDKDRLDLIILFKAKPGNENVFVVRFDSKNKKEEIETIQKHLSKYFSVEEIFQVEKVSTEIEANGLGVKDMKLTGEYVNVSFDEISFLKIGDKKHEPSAVFKSDKIIELEYNKYTREEHLTKIKNKLFNYSLFSKNTTPKLLKKSVIVENYLKDH
jgi:hypothetical protein